MDPSTSESEYGRGFAGQVGSAARGGTTTSLEAECAVLGVAHGGLSEGIRSLLATVFPSVVIVGDESSLRACVASLHPDLVAFDLALAPGRALALVSDLRRACPKLGILLLAGDEDPCVERAAREAGANGCLPKRSLGTELLPAVERLLAEREVRGA